MPRWPRYPSIYEINTWVWLAELGAQSGTPVTLGSVPGAAWDSLAARGFDAVWLMGVWERSPSGTAIANQNGGLVHGFKLALPDFRHADNVGSPYCVRRYVVDDHLGGPEGLAAAREELSRRGVRLILDFVPNHVAPDHPWVVEHPEFFVRGTPEDVRNDPASFATVGGRVFACGRDPFFPAWPDVLQLDAFDPGLRRAAIETVSEIALQCDGIRCDMAMLVLASVFERTWSGRCGRRPGTDYWEEVIPAARRANPGLLMIAEAYWDLEWEIQQKGFDFCYDKRLYDRLERGSPRSVWLHLCADLAFQAKLLRFIENHDEPRAAAVFSPEKERAAAIVASTLPGARLFHEGQLEGRKVKLPVFLGRRPAEPVDRGLQLFHEKLLEVVDAPVFREGAWSQCECTGWQDNLTYQNLVAWTWALGAERRFIVVNLGDTASQARVHVTWDDIGGSTWNLVDVLSGETYERGGDGMRDRGLYVDLGPFRFHFFEVRKA